MALNDLKDKKDEQIEQPDEGAPLRADVMGSIAGSDPASPGYLGKINHLITAHGAVDKMVTPDSTFKLSPTGSRDANLLTGATSQPKIPSSRMATAEPPAMGGGAPTAPPEMTSPLMGPAKPKQGFLGKIGHIAARMGNIAGDVLAPGVTALIPGTDLNKKFEAQRAERTAERQRQLATEEEKAKADTSRADTEAKREALAEKESGQPKPKEESWELSKDYAGPNGEPVEIEKNSGLMRLAGSDISGIKRVEKPEKETFQQQSYDEWHKTHPDGTRMQFEKELKDAERTPRQPTEREEWMKDHPGASLEEYWAAKKGPTADEQRRADLAENLNENLDTLEDIVKRRPELFGPLSGRWAELKQKFGSNDPDIATLQTTEHQLGMAQISAHGMRSAQGVAAAADSIMNSLHNGPQAVLASAQAVRNSVKTFTGDVEKKTGGSKGAAEGFKVPEGAPTAPAENGHKLKEGGKVIAVSKGGKWVAP